MSKESFENFKELITRYPDSKYTADSRLRMAYLINSIAMNDIHAARYYSEGLYCRAIERKMWSGNIPRPQPPKKHCIS
jgi:outer membrane protein assembly factor BamD (BamD/ComL family)